jgi:hypothetical protein
MHNTIYVYDADKKPTMPQSQDALIWAQWLGQPQPETPGFDSWNTNFPEYGILSTPVINNDGTIMYVVSWHNTNGGEFHLHAIDLTKASFPGPGFPPTDYRDIVKPAVISASIKKPGGGTLKLDSKQQKQRAALLLDNGVLYIGFSTNRESGGNLHGWLLAYDAHSLKQKGVWNVTPTDVNGGIWQAGSGPAADAMGNVYLMTGNGNFNADTGGKNFGDSFVKLKLENNTLTVNDYFTPCNQALLNKTCGGGQRCDLDLGSAGPLLAPSITPGADLLIGGGKDGNIYVVDTAHMGHYQRPAVQAMDCPNPNAVQAIMGPQSQQDGQGVVGNIHGSHVIWQGSDATHVFVWGENDVLRSYELKNGKLVTPPTKSLYQAPPGMPGGMLTISADGNKAGTGIVWALVPYAGDANQQRGVQAQLLAFDAHDITNDIFRSSPINDPTGPNSVGLYAKFAPPIVANGKVFVPTYGDHENPPGPTRYFDVNKPPITSVPKNYYFAVYGLNK